jgi:hypothetical protein
MELNTEQAARALGRTARSIRNYVAAGRLPAQKVGLHNDIKICVADLRTFATKYNYRIDEQFLAKLERQHQP